MMTMILETIKELNFFLMVTALGLQARKQQHLKEGRKKNNERNHKQVF